MQSDVLNFEGEADTQAMRAIAHKPIAPFPVLRPRRFHTYLTDKDFEDCGLTVAAIDSAFKVDAERLLNPPASGASAAHGGQWLMRRPVNDHGNSRRPALWHPQLERRLDDLREIAADEDLAFHEVSAKAALAFASRLPFARRPGAFLVNGNIRLVWDRAGGEQVGLQFLDNGKIQFVIFQAEGDGLGSLMGVKSPDAVLRMVMAPDVVPLIADA